MMPGWQHEKTRLAIVSLENLGRQCNEVALADPATVLAGVVRRPESTPASGLKAPAVTHISELSEVGATLVWRAARRGYGSRKHCCKVASPWWNARASTARPSSRTSSKSIAPRCTTGCRLLLARMMFAAARALPFLQAGAYPLLDLPPGALWDDQRPVAEKEWM